MACITSAWSFGGHALKAREIHVCHTCLLLATLLRGYAVVKTTPPPQNMLVRKEVATRLRSQLRGYAVTT